MKIDELIEKLNKIRKEKGNIELVLASEEYSNGQWTNFNAEYAFLNKNEPYGLYAEYDVAVNEYEIAPRKLKDVIVLRGFYAPVMQKAREEQRC